MRTTGFVLAAAFSFLLIQTKVQANLAATFPYGMNAWVESADGNTIYATVPNLNSVAVINAHTLQSTLIGIGSDPTGLCLSPDGSKLYVANNGSNFLAVMSTATQTLESPISLGSGVYPEEVVAGTNNRLWVLTGGVIEQIDATTGASTGSSIGAYGGDMRITTDGKIIYYTNFGLSPSSQAKVDVSGTNPSSLWNASLGGNPAGVAMSRDGTLVAFPNFGTSTPIFQASTMLALGSIPYGGTCITPDDEFAYYNPPFSNDYDIVSLGTYLQVGSITAAYEPHGQWASDDGQYLFIYEKGGSNSTGWQTEAFAVPEPGTVSLMGLGAVVLLRRRARGHRG